MRYDNWLDTKDLGIAFDAFALIGKMPFDTIGAASKFIAGLPIDDLTSSINLIGSYITTPASVNVQAYDNSSFWSAVQNMGSLWSNIGSSPILAALQQSYVIPTWLEKATEYPFASAITDMELGSQKIANLFGSLSNNFIENWVLPNHINAFGTLFENWPNVLEMTSLERWWARIDLENQILEEGGFSFTAHLWSVSFLSGFSNIDIRSRSAAVTNRMLAVTRGKEFGVNMEAYLQVSHHLSRRRKVIMRGLKAHNERDYVVSIPLLMMQLEGLITDMMILRRYAYSKDGALYALDPIGNPILDKHNRPTKLIGLNPKVRHADLSNDPELTSASDFLLNFLISERNGVLHGSNLSYDKARLSTQLALLLYIFAKEISSLTSKS